MKILANDGISLSGIDILKKNGHEVLTVKVAQEQLIEYINSENIDVLLVRSATKVKKILIDNCPSIKIIGRGGVGMDNIDVDYAKSKGIKVINTPNASSVSVAELVFSHLMGIVRFLPDSNRNMPLEGDKNFSNLKKNYSTGIELRGKTLGIIGLGRIGKEIAKIGLGLGMNIIYHSTSNENSADITITFFNGETKTFSIQKHSKEDLLEKSDFISINTPLTDKPIIGKKEFELMKDGAGIINVSRGGTVDEESLLEALDSGKINYAGLDVFEKEPTPNINVLMHPKISLTPHIGGSTRDAQNRIGIDLAEQIINLSKKIFQNTQR